ncbi:MAG: hypothetical protein ACREFP_02380 [Acetobacteraceae bacterium]
MLSLEQNAVTEWFTELRPPDVKDGWPPAVRPIEIVTEAAPLLEELGRRLDQLRQLDAGSLASAMQSRPLRADLKAILAQTGAARTMRLLHWLAEQDLPNSHAIAVALTRGDTPEARALRAAVAVVTRRATLGRVFAPDRIAALKSAAEAALQEST